MTTKFNPYTPPLPGSEAPFASLPSREDAPPASRLARLGAAIVDGLISAVIVVPLQIKFGVLDHFPKIRALSAGETVAWATAGFVLWVAIHGYFLATRSQTLGKRLVGVQIVDAATGRPAAFGKIVLARHLPPAIVQNIPYVGGLLNLIDVLLIFRDDRRCAHDLIAGTKVVVYREPLPAPPAG